MASALAAPTIVAVPNCSTIIALMAAMDAVEGAHGEHAVGALERRAVGARLPHRDAEPPTGPLHELLGAVRLARLGAAEFQHVAARRGVAEIMIERNDAVNFRAGNIQRVGDER